MQITYSMDCAETSYSCSAMPDRLAQTLPLHVRRCGMFDCGPNYYTRRSGLADYLLLYTIDGCGELECGEVVYALTPGTAAVVDCMKYHYYRTATNNRWRFFFVHFQGHMEGFAPILTQQGSIEVTERAEFEKTFDRLISVVRDGAPTASITAIFC